MTASTKSNHWWSKVVRLGTLTAVVLVVGVAARILQYWLQPPLWIDELMLALAIGTRHLSELARSLDLAQMAPIGFASLEWFAIETLGPGERSLRLVPMVSGIVALMLLGVLARRILSKPAAVVVVVGAALSPALLRNANEVKPYSGDAAIGLAICLLALKVVDDPSPLRRWIIWGSAAAVGAIFSFTSVLVAAATGLALLPAAVQHRRLPALVGCGAAAMVTGGATAFASRAPDLTAFMNRFWLDGFLPITEPIASFAKLVAVAGSVVARNPERPELGAIPFALGAWFGVLVMARQAPRLALLVFGPIALAAGLGIAGLYPVSARTWLFAAPLFLIGFGAAAEWLAKWVRSPRWGAPATLVTALIFLGPWIDFVIRRRIAIPRQNPKAPLAYLEQNRRAGEEPVYVFARATPAWLWYRTDWRDPSARERARRLVSARRPGMEMFHNRDWTTDLSAEALTASQSTTGRGVELLGGPSGLVFSHRETGTPDPRWPVAERRRIEGLAARCVWLFASNVHPAEWRALTVELGRAGWFAGPELRGRDRTSRFCRTVPGASPNGVGRTP